MSAAQPMSAERRAALYGSKPTPAQRRRALHKANHALAIVEPERRHWWQVWKYVRIVKRGDARTRARVATTKSQGWGSDNPRWRAIRAAWARREIRESVR